MMRARRVALLVPNNSNFHLDGDGHTQLILFNGRYADDYPAYLRSLDPSAEEGEGWARTVTCSGCRHPRAE